jgi:hypothetical protein
MNGLMQHWLLSCVALRPPFIKNFVVRATKNFSAAVWQVLSLFPWVFGVDIVFVGFFGCKIIEFMIGALSKKVMTLHPLLMVGMLAIGVMTFLMQVFFVLFLRRDHFLLNPRVYIQAYVFRYVQFVFFVSFVATLIRLMLFAGGVVTIPRINELVLFFIKALEVFALFYWLDSSHSIKALLRSFERAANLLIYTLPFVLVIAAISFGALGLLVGLVLGWDKVLQAPYGLASFVEFFVELKTAPTLWQVFAIKYIRFIIDGLTVALLYTWYRRKRGVSYTTQLFEAAVAAPHVDADEDEE